MKKAIKPNNFYLDKILENAARVDAGLPMVHPKKKGALLPAKKETYAKGEIHINLDPIPEDPRKQIRSTNYMFDFNKSVEGKQLPKTSTGLNYMMGVDDE